MKKAYTAAGLIAAAVCLVLICSNVWAEQSDFGDLSAQFRVYYLHRPFDKTPDQLSFAAGGWLSYVSPKWQGLSFGLTGYTSQPIGYQDKRKPGANLLTEDQEGYSVLGQAFIQGDWNSLNLKAGRQIIETPLINSFDVKITPVTLEALSLKYKFDSNLELSAAHLTGIKTWTDTVFQPMSQAAGLKGDEAVSLAGISWQATKGLDVQLWEYFCHEFMNMVYAQVDYDFPKAGDLGFKLSFQGIHQQDVGKALAGTFDTGQLGIQGVLSYKGADFILGFTTTSENRDIENPWGSYPGFTSIMEEDRDRAGEDSIVLGLKYDFAEIGLPGLSAYTYHTFGTTPDTGPKASPNQTEHDLTIDYRFQEGVFKGLWIRLRGAMVDEDENLGGNDFTDFRVIVNFPLKIF